MSDVANVVESTSGIPRRWFRNLRIAVSVFFSVLAVVLLLLWVRSYIANEIVSRISPAGRLTTFGLNRGSAYYYTTRHKLTPPTTSRPNRTGMIWRSHGWRYHGKEPASSSVGAKWEVSGETAHIVLPLWLFVSFAAIGVYLPWSGSRYSLRTLLIATTLVAVVLGLVCYAVR